MKNITIAYIILVASALLLVLNVSRLDFEHFSNNSFWGIISNCLIMIAMFFRIREIKKKS